MDFSLEYTKEQEEFAEEVREWLEENIPKELVIPRDACKISSEQWLIRREIGRKLGKKGWLAPGWPREYGGGGLDVDHCFVLIQEFEKIQLGLPPYNEIGLSLAAPAVLACGTEEQKKRFLPPILKGEVVTWELFTEPEAGTDEASQQTNALHHVRAKDHFIVNGQKIFVGAIHFSPPDQFLLLTRSDLKAPRHENLAMFLAPANIPGVTIQPLDLFTSGTFIQVCSPAIDHISAVKHSVFFDDARIHESHLIGGDGDGWNVAHATLTVEHGEGGFTQPIARNFAVERLIEHCKSNPNMAKRLKENPQFLNHVANVYAGVQIERLLSTRNAWLAINGRHAPYAGPQLALYSKILGARIISDMANVLGPYALSDDTEQGLDEGTFEVAQRGGVCFAPGGTPEAMKIVISRALRIGR
ncbi:acyl-CoA dehydrogenase family protein [Chloroflexota bacterium]